MKIIHENEAAENKLPGRAMRWLASESVLGAEKMSVCTIRVPAGETVRPAHSHPDGEELIFILEGSGRVLVDGEVKPVQKDTAVLFPKGSVHMLQNNGKIEMRVICFFAPPADPSVYKFYEHVHFPE
jgi:quercetin dioxygenase-like cupin family protein